MLVHSSELLARSSEGASGMLRSSGLSLAQMNLGSDPELLSCTLLLRFEVLTSSETSLTWADGNLNPILDITEILGIRKFIHYSKLLGNYPSLDTHFVSQTSEIFNGTILFGPRSMWGH